MGMRKFSTTLSLGLIFISICVIAIRGINFGLDFTGGTQLEVRYLNSKTQEAVSDQLESEGFEGAKVSQYGSQKDFLIRLPNETGLDEQALGHQVLAALEKTGEDVQLRRVEFVGAEVGEHLTEQGGLAILVAILATMIYIAMRFEYRFAISAAIALLHDPILILGCFALFQFEFDLATLAAMLAVIGYSLNDTIVVYDRVRENFRRIRKGTTKDVMNLSINQTLSRTLMTSFLTLLVVVALVLFGGESLFGFSFALTVGIIVGTYSSIYVAGSLALWMGLSKTDLIPVAKKVDDMP